MKSKTPRKGRRAAAGTARTSGGRKRRSPTSNPHNASREEPSHITDRRRKVRAKKSARGK